MLARQEFREFIVQKLQQNAKVSRLVGQNIFDSKPTVFEIKNLPGINVVTQNQNATSQSINIPSFNATLKINLEIYVSGLDGWMAKADEIAEAVEECLLTDPEFIGMSSEITSYDVDYSLYDQGAQPIAVEILSFNLSYLQDYKIQAENNFNEVRIGVDVVDPISKPRPGPDGRIEFEVNINNLGEYNARETQSE